jgi:hypothetical protein
LFDYAFLVRYAEYRQHLVNRPQDWPVSPDRFNTGIIKTKNIYLDAANSGGAGVFFPVSNERHQIAVDI